MKLLGDRATEGTEGAEFQITFTLLPLFIRFFFLLLASDLHLDLPVHSQPEGVKTHYTGYRNATIPPPQWTAMTI